jgi:hypothetical protein
MSNFGQNGGDPLDAFTLGRQNGAWRQQAPGGMNFGAFNNFAPDPTPVGEGRMDERYDRRRPGLAPMPGDPGAGGGNDFGRNNGAWRQDAPNGMNFAQYSALMGGGWDGGGNGGGGHAGPIPPSNPGSGPRGQAPSGLFGNVLGNRALPFKRGGPVKGALSKMRGC